MNIFKLTLINTTDFHTRGDVQGSTIDYLKNFKEVPYIPATHIKGVMRTEAERIMHSVMKYKDEPLEPDNVILDTDIERIKDLNTKKELNLREISSTVCNIFGKIHSDTVEGYHEGKIKITDFIANEEILSASRMYVSINRNFLSKQERALFKIRTVPAGSRFTGYILTQDLNDEENKLLLGSLHSMCHYGLGGNRSRGLGNFIIEGPTKISYEEFVKGGVLY